MHFLNGTTIFRRAAAVFFLAGALANARAGVITGQISGTGVFTPYTSTTGSGTTTSDLTAAHSFNFATIKAGVGNTGSFTNFGTNTVITFQNPFQVNPVLGSANPLWTVSNLSFKATSLTTLYALSFSVGISGTGIFQDGTNSDATPATFLATFTQTGTSPNYNYTMNFSTVNFVPSLSLNGVGAQSTLSWDTNSTNFILQSTPIMSKFPVWTNLTNIPAIVGGNYVVSNFVSTNGQKYYRLKH